MVCLILHYLVCKECKILQSGLLLEAHNYSAGLVSKPICPETNSSTSQFGEKLNNFDLTSLTLKRQQKKFVMSQRQCYAIIYFSYTKFIIAIVAYLKVM